MSELPTALEVLNAVKLVSKFFGLRWYVFGSLAVMSYARERPVEDVDITVELKPEQVKGFVEALAQAGVDPQEELKVEGQGQTQVLHFVHRRTGMKLNAVVANSGLENDFLARSRKMEVSGVELPFISPEDLIITKVVVGRPKDLDDVRAVIEEQDDVLDLETVRVVLTEVGAALGRGDLVSILEGLVPGPNPSELR